MSTKYSVEGLIARRHREACKAYQAAQQALEEATLDLIRIETLKLYPDAAELNVHGEYNEESEIRVSLVTVIDENGVVLGSYDDKHTDTWDELDENLNEGLMWLATAGDEEWLGDNHIDMEGTT